MNERSCVGCKFLYSQDSGYSNWTVEETEILCAKKRNPNLPASEAWDWKKDEDNWPATKDSRCDLYAPGEMIQLDVDGENTVESQTTDREVIDAISNG